MWIPYSSGSRRRFGRRFGMTDSRSPPVSSCPSMIGSEVRAVPGCSDMAAANIRSVSAHSTATRSLLASRRSSRAWRPAIWRRFSSSASRIFRSASRTLAIAHRPASCVTISTGTPAIPSGANTMGSRSRATFAEFPATASAKEISPARAAVASWKRSVPAASRQKPAATPFWANAFAASGASSRQLVPTW